MKRNDRNIVGAITWISISWVEMCWWPGTTVLYQISYRGPAEDVLKLKDWGKYCTRLIEQSFFFPIAYRYTFERWSNPWADFLSCGIYPSSCEICWSRYRNKVRSVSKSTCSSSRSTRIAGRPLSISPISNSPYPRISYTYNYAIILSIYLFTQI